MELIFEAFLEWCTRWAPKPIRIGCTVVLLIIVAALFGWAIWSMLT